MIQIRFFNASVENFATASLFENLLDKSLTVSLTQGSDNSWIKFFYVQDVSQMDIVIQNSIGTESVIRVSLETPNTDAKSQIQALSIKSASSWQTYSTTSPGSTEQRSALHQAVLAEEARLFTTDGMSRIGELMKGLDILDSHASNTGSRDRLDSSCADDSVPRWGEPAPLYHSPALGGGCGGRAFCTRIATIIPVFFCNGGNSCTGVYII